MTQVKKLLVAVAAVAVLASTGAKAEGFLAGLARDMGVINEDQRRALDDAHAQMGRPLDHMANQAAGAAADYFVPGSGQFVTGGLEARDRFNRGGGFRGGPQGGFGGAPQVSFGNFCGTPAGRFGPGPTAPIGSPCNAFGYFGQVTY